MAFYPLIKIPDFFAKTTLFNFAPNNWEVSNIQAPKFINASWAQGGLWHTQSMFLIDPGGYSEVTSEQCSTFADDAHIFLSMSCEFLSETGTKLPNILQGGTSYPQWRANMQISSQFACTSYLGEISPFPSRSSCLSFGGMIQPPPAKNALIFMNLEQSAINREEVLEIYDSTTGQQIDEFRIRNNSINLIELDLKQLESCSLPVIICRAMGGIPLYFSRDDASSSLSLEHTHPPSSYVVHGDRNAVQRELKKYWFEKCKK